MIGFDVGNIKRADDRLGAIAHSLPPIFGRSFAGPFAFVRCNVHFRRLFEGEAKRGSTLGRGARGLPCGARVGSAQTKLAKFKRFFACVGERDDR